MNKPTHIVSSIPCRSEAELLAALHLELASSRHPREQQLLRCLIGFMPQFATSFDRERIVGIVDPVGLLASVTHTMLSTMADSLTSDTVSSHRLQKHALLTIGEGMLDRGGD